MLNHETRDTKEAILYAALKLFSRRGYNGVGIRDIANELGIRESALYKHYKGKQDIFQSILTEVNERYDAAVTSFRLPETVTSSFTGDEREELFTLCVTMFRFYLEDESASQLRRMLTMEQYRNTAAGEMFRKLLIDRGLDSVAAVFTKLIEKGRYREADARIMAYQFYAPLYLLLCRYDRFPEQYPEALQLLEKHIIQFDSLYTYAENGSEN